MGTDFALEARNISKQFGAVLANDDICLEVKKASVHGIVGENGAGKSTLLKILFGFYQPSSGSILVDGAVQKMSTPSDAMAHGIAMVHQHFMLVEPFTVFENIILGAEGGAFLKRSQTARAALQNLQKQFGLSLDLDATVSDLSVGQRQRVEILKALYRGANILILDEPTAVLTPQECDQLFALIRRLKGEGKTILFVTHKLNEIMAVTDRVTVIRAGRVIGSHDTTATNPGMLAEEMVGRKISREVMAEKHEQGENALVLESVSLDDDLGHSALKSISFTVRRGEILGVAGVAGNGQTELLEAIAGLRPLRAGQISLGGHAVQSGEQVTNPLLMRGLGLAHIPEDRLKTGVVPSMTAAENAILGYQADSAYTRSGIMSLRAIKAKAAAYFESQDVRPRNPSLPVAAFSGGNQQKLVIAREIDRKPDVLIIGQPTRGVDIGAVTKIHDQLTELRNAGKALLVVSADLDELLAISDRIAVMCEGELMGILDVDEADERTLGLMMAGSHMPVHESAVS